jgi:undecaprenyl diphosphate synthase
VELLEVMASIPSGTDFVTLYGFSTENWKRSRREVQEIFQVMEMTARSVLWRHRRQQQQQQQRRPAKGQRRPVQVRILGDLDDVRIPHGLRGALRELQDATCDDDDVDPLTVCLAINYGGRQDIVRAVQRLARDVAEGTLDPQFITADSIAHELCTSDIPDPDMIIRTSGERRLSNFLLWDCAYSELYFTDTLWPDFDTACWEEALSWYQQRQRRFGARNGQQEEEEEEEDALAEGDDSCSAKRTIRLTNNGNGLHHYINGTSSGKGSSSSSSSSNNGIIGSPSIKM